MLRIGFRARTPRRRSHFSRIKTLEKTINLDVGARTSLINNDCSKDSFIETHFFYCLVPRDLEP